MNSDEPKIPEQEQEPQPIAEVLDEQKPEIQPVTGASEDLEEQLPTDSDGLATPASEDENQVATDSEVFAVADTDANAAQSNEPLPALELLNSEELTANTAQVTPLLDDNKVTTDLTQTVADLQRQEQELRQQIASLQETQSKILAEQLSQTQAAVDRILQEGLSELEQRKQALQISVEQLERRRDRIRAEMRTSFAGVSQDLAIRVQGFKDYLVGSLQDLASTAEQLDLAPVKESPQASIEESRPPEKNLTPKFAEQGFQEQARQIRKIIDQYRTMPDYYGPSWQLRRTFEPVHAERVSNWFFTQGGRGAIKTMGSRLQNVLIASATISVLRTIYGDRLRTLIIANTPERLGEWRRGLQDCLGISRSDFGPERGLVLFEEAPALVQKAERLLAQKQLPFILIDETEDQINLALLQFPLWLAFAPDPQQMSNNYQY